MMMKNKGAVPTVPTVPTRCTCFLLYYSIFVLKIRSKYLIEKRVGVSTVGTTYLYLSIYLI